MYISGMICFVFLGVVEQINMTDLNSMSFQKNLFRLPPIVLTFCEVAPLFLI